MSGARSPARPSPPGALGLLTLSVPAPPGVRPQGPGAGPGRRRPAHAPAAASSRSRLGPAPRLPAPEPSPRGGRDPAPGGRARIACPGWRRPVWDAAGLSFCSSRDHAPQPPKPKACVPGVALVRGSWARGARGPEAGPAAPRPSPPRAPPSPRLPAPARPAATGAHVGSGRAPAGERVLGPRRRRSPGGARVRGAPGPLLPFPPKEPQNFGSAAVKRVSGVYILCIYTLFTMFHVGGGVVLPLVKQSGENNLFR